MKEELAMLNPYFLFLLSAIGLFIVIRFLFRTSAISVVKNWWQFIEEKCYAYQLYRVPQFNENMQENQLYKKVYTYLNSLPAVENSDFANLFSGSKANEISLVLDKDQKIIDSFLNANLCWSSEICSKSGRKSLILKIKKQDKRRILSNYFEYINGVFEENEQEKKEVKLFINVENGMKGKGRWISVPFTHPATIETVVMEADLKEKVKSDLETFLKSKKIYNRLGRVWKRSYLLYGPSGTGKSTFIAAMAKFLNYDVYDIDLSRVSDDSDLKMLSLQTMSKSLLVIEDLDRFLAQEQKPSPTAETAVSLSGILNFMDGLISSCGEERVMVFTMNSKDRVDPTVLRPGRIDVHLHFPTCDFNAFKTMANSHLGLKSHKLFPQVENIFQNGGTLSQSEIGEIMIANRSSPSRALKSVICALQSNLEVNLASRIARRLPGYETVAAAVGVDQTAAGETGMFCRESFGMVKECRKLYGFFKKSSRRESMDLDTPHTEKEIENLDK